MLISKRHLPRRTVLRGLGATMALPLLDSMVPALTAMRRTDADLGVEQASSRQRLERFIELRSRIQHGNDVMRWISHLERALIPLLWARGFMRMTMIPIRP